MKNKDPGLAGVFSAIFPGLGQVYNEQIGKGLILFSISLIPAFFIVLVFIETFFIYPQDAGFGIVNLVMGAVVYMALWGVSVADAQKIAYKINESLKICPKCGNENPEDSKFCKNCGIELKSLKIEI